VVYCSFSGLSLHWRQVGIFLINGVSELQVACEMVHDHCLVQG
jgi:hypothetical protein